MTKEELQALGLTDEQITELFKINGKDVEKAKGDLATKETELASTKEQLKTANTEIESYKSMDVEGIKKAADDYKAKYEASEAKAKEELETLKFNHAIENALGAAKAKNVKAVKALLNVEGLKLNGDEIIGLKDQIEGLKKDNDYLFDDTDPAGTGGSKGGGAKGGGKGTITKEEFDKLSYKERVELFNKQPEIYKTLKE